MTTENNTKILHAPRWSYDILVAFIFFIVALSLRAYRYTELAVNSDEITYSWWAYSILSHSWAWPPEFMAAHPPLIPYTLALITYFFEGGLEVFRVVPILFGSLTVCVIYFLGKLLYNRWVGLLSATLLSFSYFHILFSRMIYFEAPVIFFIFTAMYFFWKSYKEDSVKYACVTGFFLGLAIDTKYVGLLLYPAFALFIVWTKKKGWFSLGWKSLVEKKFLLIVLVSLIVFSPVLIYLHINDNNPFYWQLVERYSSEFAGYGNFEIVELIERGFDNYVSLLIGFFRGGENIATLSLPWFYTFKLAASFLLISTILYYLYHLSKGKESDSFLMIFFIVFNVFVAVFGTRFQYYLLWALPAFFIMMSHMIVSFTNHIRLRFTEKGLTFSFSGYVRILTLVFACIFIFSYIVTGIMTPSVEEGPLSGYDKQVMDIKDKIKPGESIAADNLPVVNYYFDKYDFNAQEHDIHLLPLYKRVKKQRGVEIIVDIEMLDLFKPRFLITTLYFYSAYADIREKVIITENYVLISEKTGILLYERKIKEVKR